MNHRAVAAASRQALAHSENTTMLRYFVNRNAQRDGDHEVHAETCSWLMLAMRKVDLGVHASCQEAVEKARQTYPRSRECCWCSNTRVRT